MGDDRQYATATLRNRDFILDVLRDVLPMTGVIREVASASGEHVVHFARDFPTLVFQPSDPEPNPRLSVAAWVKAAGVTNVRAPIGLDASNLVWPIASADGIICINTVHISPWEATLDQGRRRSTSTVHTNAKSSQRPLATNHSIGSLAGDRSDWRHLSSSATSPPVPTTSTTCWRGVRRFDRDAADRRVAVDHDQRGSAPPAALISS
jgi:Protein of unknown function (DUF938)